MAARKQVWRLTWFGRIVAVVFGTGLAALAITWLVAPDPFWVHLLAAVPAALTIIPWRCARSKVVLTADAVVIHNVCRVHHVPLSQVRSVTNRFRGAVRLRTADGELIEIFAVHTPVVALALGRRSRANEMMEAIEDAALASGAQIPTGRLRNAVGASTTRPAQASAPPAVPLPSRYMAGQVGVPGVGFGEVSPGSAGSAGQSWSTRHLLPGRYRASEVDALIERIQATLAGTTEPGQAVTAADVRAARFGITRRGGYDQSMVDQALEEYAEQLEWKQGP